MSDLQIERGELRTYNAVVEHGGFSKAAERLDVSQSAVSQAVANLEYRLGAPLLIRSRQLELTEAGKRMYTYARLVIREERTALEDLAQIKAGALSSLSLAMNSMVNQIYAPELLLKFCEANPLTSLQVDVIPSRAIVDLVDEGRYELGFGPFLHQMPTHFTVHDFGKEERVLVVHETHPAFELLQRDPLTGLAQCTLLTSYLDDTPKAGGGAAAGAGADAEGNSGTRVRDRFVSVWAVGHLQLRLQLAAAGKGLLYLSDHLLAANPGFHVVGGVEFARIERRVGVYHKKHQPLSEGARRFLAICEREFPQPTPV